MSAAVFMLVSFVLALPAVLYFSYAREKAEIQSQARNRHGSVIMRRNSFRMNLKKHMKYRTMHGVVSEAFKPGVPFFVAIYEVLIRRCLFVIVSQLLYAAEVDIRPQLLSTWIGFYIIQHMREEPFADDSFNRFEFIVLLDAWLISLFCRGEQTNWQFVVYNILLVFVVLYFIPLLYHEVRFKIFAALNS